VWCLASVIPATWEAWVEGSWFEADLGPPQRTGVVAQVVKSLPSKHEVENLSTTKKNCSESRKFEGVKINVQVSKVVINSSCASDVYPLHPLKVPRKDFTYNFLM
jgi:hypothetical protein